MDMKLRMTPKLVPAILLALAIPIACFAVNPGEKAPAFALTTTDGETYDSKNVVANHEATVIVFTCNTCPVARAYEDRIIATAKEYAPRKVAFLAVNPNDADKIPQENMESMKKRAAEKGFPFPYLRDDTQSVAKSYGAKVTPHFFVADKSGVIRYVGRFDNNQQQNPNVKTATDLQNALDAVLAGNEPLTSATKAFGCGIKWK